MKKIGCVITYKDNDINFGSLLQNYAFLRKIQELGYDYEIIVYKKHISFLKKIWLIIQMLRIKAWDDQVIVFKDKIYRKIHIKYFQNKLIRCVASNKFKEEKFKHLVHKYDSFEQLQKGSLNYDVVIVGSDQLWTPMSLYSKFYNLLFVDDSIPKIAYAPSFGVSKIPKIQIKQTGKYLDRFDFIGVRELQGKKIVESISKNKAKVVCDPTILLTREEWEKEITISTVKISEHYIFCYLLSSNPDSRKIVNELKQKTGLKIIALIHNDEYVKCEENFGDETPYDVSPLDFVKYISEATYVCTDSFHGSVFSILFHKQFITFYRYSAKNKESRNSRIDSLFEIVDLKSRIYKNDILNSIKQNINYNEVEEKIKLFREESFNFLKESLEKSCSKEVIK